MKSIEVSAKSKESAIMDGLNQLGVSIDMVSIEVLNEGGLFSKCKLRLTVIEEEEDILDFKSDYQEKTTPAPKQEKPFVKQAEPVLRQEKPVQKQEKAPVEAQREDKDSKKDRKPKRLSDGFTYPRTVKFVSELLTRMGNERELQTAETEEQFIIEIVGDEAGLAIGYRGETLDAIQYLASQIANQERENSKKIVVDCQNYRQKRSNTLVALAERMAEKAIRTQRRVRMEPMNAYERRIIHASLAENEEVTTSSEGIEPNRYLVIVPKNCRSDRPERPGGNNRNGGYRDGNRGGYRNNNNNRGRNDFRSDNKSVGSGFSENQGFGQSSGFEEDSFIRKNRDK